VEGDSHRDLLAPLGELARELGVSVEVCETPGSSHGFFAPNERRIGVSSELSGNAQVATLIHELAHALTALEREDEDPELSYAAEELVVESVVFWPGLDECGLDAGFCVGDGCHRRGMPLEGERVDGGCRLSGVVSWALVRLRARAQRRRLLR